MSEKKSELWQRVRAARKFAKLTQDQLAEMYGVKRAAVSHHESADPTRRVNPSAKQLMTLGMASGVPPEYFLNDSMAVDDIYRIKTFQPVKLAPKIGEQLDAKTAEERWNAALRGSKVIDALSSRVVHVEETVRGKAAPGAVKGWMPRDVEQISVLLDMIGEEQTRSLAYQAATAAILNVVKGRMPPPASH